MGKASQVGTIFLYLVTFFFQIQCHVNAISIGFSLELIPSNSIESPLYPRNLSQLARIQRAVDCTKERADHLESISTLHETMNPENIILPMNRLDTYYVTKIRIGRPSTEVTLLVDTSSNFIWTQCEPCKSCYPQKTKIYDSRNSTTYAILPYQHSLCRSWPFRHINRQCIYTLSYGSGTTKGIASWETFGFPLRKGTHKLISKIIFGCSNNNRGFAFAKNKDDTISGILGLGKSPGSLINQVSHLVNGRFSYCLYEGSSYLRFGEDIVLRGQDVKTIPFMNPRSPLYNLNLIDISVDKQRLGFPRGTFSFRNVGCVIDNGSPVSAITRKAYGKVIRVFENYYAGKLERVDGRTYHLELCYKYNETFQRYPSMTFHFQGADFVIDPRFMHISFTEARHICIALVPSYNITILGALQQWDKRIVYDINDNLLQFVEEKCSNDRG